MIRLWKVSVCFMVAVGLAIGLTVVGDAKEREKSVVGLEGVWKSVGGIKSKEKESGIWFSRSEQMSMVIANGRVKINGDPLELKGDTIIIGDRPARLIVKDDVLFFCAVDSAALPLCDKEIDLEVTKGLFIILIRQKGKSSGGG